MKLKKLLAYLKDHEIVIVTAESCTAGLIAGRLAEAPGAGSALEVGYVVYAPQAKQHCLGVSPDTIERYGLTSEPVSIEMALGALQRSGATIAIANTGVADDPSGTSDVPAGTLCFAWAVRAEASPEESPQVYSETVRFSGSRNAIRRAAADHALERIPHYHRLSRSQTGSPRGNQRPLPASPSC